MSSDATKRKHKKKEKEVDREDSKKLLGGDEEHGGVPPEKSYGADDDADDNPWACTMTGYYMLYLFGILLALVAAGVILILVGSWDFADANYLNLGIWGGLFVCFFVWYQLQSSVSKSSSRVWQMILMAYLAGVVGGWLGGKFYQEYYNDKDAIVSREVKADNSPKAYAASKWIQFPRTNMRVQAIYTGVFTVNGATYCVAPILTKAAVPQDKIYYWAVGKDCCSGAYPSVVATCASWATPDYVEGELVKGEDIVGYRKAAGVIATALKVTVDPQAMYLEMNEYDEYNNRQERRTYYTALFVGCAALLWPLLLVVSIFAVTVYTSWLCGTA